MLGLWVRECRHVVVGEEQPRQVHGAQVPEGGRPLAGGRQQRQQRLRQGHVVQVDAGVVVARVVVVDEPLGRKRDPNKNRAIEFGSI